MKAYERRVTKAKHRPADGSEPLTVVEFSLMPEVKAGLMRSLRSYVRGDKTPNDAQLERVIRAHFPEQVLDELKALGKRDENSATVYVVHNLPEYKDEAIAKLPEDQQITGELGPVWSTRQSYAKLISRGVALATGLQQKEAFALTRKASDTKPVGDYVHKHSEDVTMLSVVKSDASATRFVDLQTALEDQEARKVRVVTLGNDNDMALSHFGESRSWRPAQDNHLKPVKNAPGELNGKPLEALMDKHAMDVTTHDGDLVLWSNHGRLWHQARLPGYELVDSHELIRVALSAPNYIR
ncbi:MAG: hypothetical protein K2Q01_08625 [Rickettsiales bacterium]|nr:hypothetical protein [Rickettsiales bacterium]